jgi:hypothetical protein
MEGIRFYWSKKTIWSPKWLGSCSISVTDNSMSNESRYDCFDIFNSEPDDTTQQFPAQSKATWNSHGETMFPQQMAALAVM